MSDVARRAIDTIDWSELERRLAAADGDGDDEALRSYFGDQEFADLRQLARRARRSRDRGVCGNVVFLPGIMGSNLSLANTAGGGKTIWLNLLRIVTGEIEHLKLPVDGDAQAPAGGPTVVPSGIDRKTYARAVLQLRQRWNVMECPYDWRRDIDEAATRLADVIGLSFPRQPVHIVAHSMGGLVARNFIRRYRQQWDAIRGNGAGGGRLIMLGTPNHGSFTIPQVLTGQEKVLRLLAKVDLRHDLQELLAITNTFVGSYQMLPSPGKLPDSARALYLPDAWGDCGVIERCLQRAAEFHERLAVERTVDPDRMFYVAGFNRETVDGMRIVAPGEFDYSATYAGDGRVPHSLGLLKDVTTYYVEEAHGDLPRNDTVMTAVLDLLEHGSTSVLPTQVPFGRMVRAGQVQWRRSIVDVELGDRLARVAARAAPELAPFRRTTGPQSLPPVDPEVVRDAEEVLRRAAQGRDNVARPLTDHLDKQARIEVETRERVRLTVQVQHGDVTRAPAPLVVVGHYQGTTPTNAVGTVDKALDRAFSHVLEKNMFSCNLGEVLYLPTGLARAENWITAPAVLVAGMGPFGEFSKDDLRYLMQNVCDAALLLRLNSFATVVVGSGLNNLSRGRAVRAILEGVCDSLSRPPRHLRPTVTRLAIVEKDTKACDEIRATLDRLAAEASIPDLDLVVERKVRALAEPDVRPAKAIAGGPALEQTLSDSGMRMTIERDGDKFRFSALTDDAVIPVRDVDVQGFFSDGIAERLMNAQSRADQEKYGRLMNTYLIPEDFQRHMEPGRPLTLILDRTTAGLPWEMASFKSSRGVVSLGPDLQLTRQFRTTLSSTVGLPPPPNRLMRVLVVADPAPEPHLQLSGARREGREVANRLRELARAHHLSVDVVDRIGPSDCDPVEILALILGGEFDIVHFAGHGFFDVDKPERGGWVFGEKCTLSAREIFRSRRVPQLVFANACYSAVVNSSAAAGDGMNRHLAGLVEAFFDRGIANYVGAGWPVADDAAVTFATSFYAQLFAGETLGTAVAESRKAILAEGASWGAYQHYGLVNTRLITSAGRPPGAAAGPKESKGRRRKRRGK